MKLKDMIGSMVTKFAALLFAFTCAGTAWGATVTTEAELRTAIANGGAVTLGADIALTQGEIAVSNTVTLDLGTYTISSPTNVFRVAANGNFTVNADATSPGGISTPTNRCCVYTSYGWDPGAKTVVLNAGVFEGNCVFNWATNALSNYVSHELYGLALDGAGSGQKAVPTSVTINGGTFQGGNDKGNVGEYRCYYFTVNGGTFEKGLDCADTEYCTIGVTTTCKAYFNGGRYRNRYPTFRKKKQGLSIVDDPGKVFIGTASHTNSYYIADGYYVNAYDRSACEVTGTYAGAAVQSTYWVWLTTGFPQRWYNPSATWYFLTAEDAADVGASNVIYINGANGAGQQVQASASPSAARTSASVVRLSSGTATLRAAKSVAAPARLMSASPARLASSASSAADVITTRPAGTELGEIKVVDNDNHTYITQNADSLAGTEFKTELDADRIDACYFFGPASSRYITANDGSDDAAAYAAIYKRVLPAAMSFDEEPSAAMALSFTSAERQLLLDNALSLALEDGEISQDCFSDNGDGSYAVNFESNDGLDGMILLYCIAGHSTLATSEANPFENDPHLTWIPTLVVSFDKAVAADSVRVWYATQGQQTVGDGHLRDSGIAVGALAANAELSLPLDAGLGAAYFDVFFVRGTGAPFPLIAAVQNKARANIGTAVTVKLRVTNPNDSAEYADRASFTHVFAKDNTPEVSPVEGSFEEYDTSSGSNVHWGEYETASANHYVDDNGVQIGTVYSSTRTALETAFNAIENVSETGLGNVTIAAAEGETQQKWVQIEWHGLVNIRDGEPMTTIAFGIAPQLRTITDSGSTVRAITNAELDGQTITFRLPLTDDYTARALVVHTSDDYPEDRWIANVEGSTGARYVEISTTHFSEFLISPLGANDIVYVTSAAGAFIGGYTTLADAYAATEDGGTIYLLKNVSENLEVASAKTFNINVGEFTYSGAVTAASGYVLSATTSGTTTTYAAAVAIAQIGTTKYTSLAAAVAAAQSGDTIELLTDVEIASTVSLNKVGTYTIDGKGFTISMAEGADFGADGAISCGISDGASADIATKVYTVTDVTFSGFDSEIVRAENCTLTLDGCTFDSNAITKDAGGRGSSLVLVSNAGATVQNCTFSGNSGKKCIDFNSQLKSLNAAAGSLTVTSNEFTSNSFTGSGVIFSNGSAGTSDVIVDNSFVSNVISSSASAVLYLSGTVDEVSGNYFYSNTIAATDNGKEGVIVLGSKSTGTAVIGNAFVSNTLDTGSSKRATVYTGADCNLSGNYWGDGAEPETDAVLDIAIDAGKNPTITTDTYATAYAVNENGCGVTVTLYVPPVAQIGETKYETIAAAVAAASTGDTIKLIADADEDVSLATWKNNAITFDLGGHTLTGQIIAPYGAKTDGIVIKNGNIVGRDSSLFYCLQFGYGSGNATLENLSVTQTSKNYRSYAVFFQQTDKRVTMRNVTLDGRFYTANSGSTIAIESGVYKNSTGLSNADISNGGVVAAIGGTFYYNPTTPNNLVAKGYIATETTDDEDVQCWVVELGPAFAKVTLKDGTETEFWDLDEAIGALAEGATLTIKPDTYTLASANYTLPKDVKIIGVGESGARVKITSCPTFNSANGLTIENVDFDGGYSWQPSAVTVHGDATFKNCTITCNQNAVYYSTVNGTLTFDGCTITAGVYALNIGEGTGDVIVKDCTISGWTSFGNVGKTIITGTTFEEGDYNYLRFYQDAVIDDCSFNNDMLININETGKKLVVSDSAFENGSSVASAIGQGEDDDPPVDNYIAVGTRITTDEDGFVTGGVFDKIDDGIIADGYISVDNLDGETMENYPLTVGGPYEAIVLDENGGFVNGYTSLAAALDAAQDGQTVKLLADAAQNDGIIFDKAGSGVILDLDSKTFTVNTGANCNNRAFRIDNGTLTVKNGSIVAAGSGTTSSNGAGCYGAFRVEKGGTLNVQDATLSNSRPWGLNVKILGGRANLERVTINSSYGGGIEVSEADLGALSQPGYAELTDCTFTQTGYFDHCSTALSVSGGSELVVNSGTYTSENYGLYVFSSGGKITVKGGTITGESQAAVKAEMDTNTYPAYTGAVQISGGRFTGALSVTSPASMSISGGVFSSEITASYCAVGYEVVANADEETKEAYPWTVAHKDGVYVVKNDDGEGYAEIPAVKVDADWINANVTKTGETATTADIEAALNTKDDDTNLKKWQAYVLNQTEEPIKVTSVANDGALSTTLVEAKTGTGLDVSYSLVSVDGESETDGTASANKSFALEKAEDGSLETGLYKVRVHFKPTGDTSASEVTVDSENTVGVLKTTPASSLVVVPVPFKALGGSGEINVSDYIKSGLATGDTLHVYNGDKYDTWEYNGSSWNKTTNVTKTDENTESISESAPATTATLARGTAAILRRAAGNTAPLVFVGDYTGAAEEQTITAGWNLVASPSIEAFDPATKFTSGKIQIPTGGIPKNYTYSAKTGKWGYSGVVKDGNNLKIGRIEVETLPAGTGFWYISDTAATVEW